MDERVKNISALLSFFKTSGKLLYLQLLQQSVKKCGNTNIRIFKIIAFVGPFSDRRDEKFLLSQQQCVLEKNHGDQI